VAGMRRLPCAVLVVVAGLAGLAACATPSAPVSPLYTPAERKAQCERQGGWWHRDDLRGDFCEPNGQM
jgi:endonuclease YncB( thermonuclease family)